MAEKLLELTTYSLEMNGEPIPKASSSVNIRMDKQDSFVTLISVNMPLVLLSRSWCCRA